jgi:hypothetical protein
MIVHAIFALPNLSVGPEAVEQVIENMVRITADDKTAAVR